MVASVVGWVVGVTVVAGFADGCRVWMASDTVSVDAWDTVARVPSKVLRLEVGAEEALLGVAGSAAMLPMLQFEADLPSVVGEDLDGWAWRVARYLTDMARELRHPLGDDDGKTRLMVLLGFRGRLWYLSTNESHPILERYSALGSGDNLALGAMHAYDHVGRLAANPGRWVQAAVDAACAWDAYCRGPVVLEVLG